jgi:DNA primase large subunit
MAFADKLSIKAKYPFLPEAKQAFISLGFDLESFRDPSTKPIVDRAISRIVDALLYGENINPNIAAEDDLTELASFPLAIILAAKTGDKYLQRRFALAEASTAYKRLNMEGDPELVLRIAREVFRIDVEYDDSYPPYSYTVGLADYLKSASKFNDPVWKLVNRIVVRGRVYIESRELIRLLRDKIERYILENIEKAEKEVGKLPENLEEAVNNIKNKLPERKIEDLTLREGSRPEAWPPCMKSIYSKLTSGESVSHFANFMIAAFLINTGVPTEEIISIYSQRSDFNERIARYQVEHIAGMRGSRTRYITPSCSKIKTNGLCIEDGRLCGNIKNPMTYYKKKIKEIKKIDKDKTQQTGEYSQSSS